MNNRVEPRLARALTLFALAVVLLCLAGRVFWLTQAQFAACNEQIWNKPQPRYCEFTYPLYWIIGYGPLLSLAVSLFILLIRRQRWYASPIIPVVVFWLSALLLVPTLFGTFVGWFLRDMH